MRTYLSLDLVDTQPAGGADARDGKLSRDVRIVDSGFGARVSVPVGAMPAVRRTVRWDAYGLAEEAELRDFIDRRKGRRVPFWLGPMGQDVELSKSIKFTDTGFSFYSIDYAAMWAMGQARRHWYIGDPAFYVDTFEAMSAPTDNGDGTEKVSAGIATTGFPNIVGWMLYGRLADDVVRFERLASRVVTCTFDFVELPLETP